MQGTLGELKNTSFELNRFRIRGNTVGGILNHVRGCGPEKMRIMYHLPEHGAWGRVAWAFVRYFCSRTWRVVCAWIGDGGVRDYCRMVETLEKKNSPFAKNVK